LDALAPAESVTVIVTEKLPMTLVVPEITPVFASMFSPTGRPLAAHAYGVVPALAATVVEYAVPWCAAGSDAVLIAGTSLIVNEYVFDPVAPAASVTVTTTLNVPFCVGVPEMSPPLPVVVIDMPAGNPVALHVYGPVPADSVIGVSGYCRPFVHGASGEAGLVTVGTSLIVIE
jgi:hypothetical protein